MELAANSRGAGGQMDFIVRSDDGTFSATKQTRDAALETAYRIIAQGMKDVTITDSDGHVYDSSQFHNLFERRAAGYKESKPPSPVGALRR
jgi:hypothetical protein